MEKEFNRENLTIFDKEFFTDKKYPGLRYGQAFQDVFGTGALITDIFYFSDKDARAIAWGEVE